MLKSPLPRAPRNGQAISQTFASAIRRQGRESSRPCQASTGARKRRSCFRVVFRFVALHIRWGVRSKEWVAALTGSNDEHGKGSAARTWPEGRMVGQQALFSGLEKGSLRTVGLAVSGSSKKEQQLLLFTFTYTTFNYVYGSQSLTQYGFAGCWVRFFGATGNGIRGTPSGYVVVSRQSHGLRDLIHSLAYLSYLAVS